MSAGLSVKNIRLSNPLSLSRALLALGMNAVPDAITSVTGPENGGLDVLTIDFGIKKGHVFFKPGLVTEILANEEVFQKARPIADITSLFNGRSGIFFSYFEDWERQRRTAMPFFRNKAVNDYREYMQECIDSTIDKWKRDGKTDDLFRDCCRLSMNIIFSVIFKRDISQITDEIIDNVGIINENILQTILNPLSYLFQKRICVMGKSLQAKTFIISLIEDLCADRLDAYVENDIISEFLKSSGYYESPTKENKEQAYEELFYIIMAGFEASASAMTWALYDLAEHPAWQDALLTEANEVLGGRFRGSEDIRRLKQQNMFLSESLRTNTIVYMAMLRQAQKDVKIANEFAVKAGEYIAIPVENIHRDPRWFPAPSEFIPERHDLAAVKHRPKGAFLPFLDGGHRCVGRQLFFEEAAMLITETLRAFRLQADTRPAAVYKGTMRPEENGKMLFLPRSGAGLDCVPQNSETAPPPPANDDGAGEKKSKCPFAFLHS